ncbi:hypothetical protein [Burkholderia cenocepacia]|uniref:Uncharacterized protein n=1 Tax=Burkholderia cenocepacia TaxID=95486 RepID=A0A3Q9F533_9BURK|nr:hypothetical protein [Burkholderia cenocepacia]AZQ52915.1 hypothetical protein D5R55_18060 [Burkholderia cenocepacia]
MEAYADRLARLPFSEINEKRVIKNSRLLQSATLPKINSSIQLKSCTYIELSRAFKPTSHQPFQRPHFSQESLQKITN